MTAEGGAEVDDGEIKVRAHVEYLRQLSRSPRAWLTGVAREAIVALVLLIGLWGLDVEPVTAARAAVGLWWIGMVGYACIMALFGGLAGAMGWLFSVANTAQGKS